MLLSSLNTGSTDLRDAEVQHPNTAKAIALLNAEAIANKVARTSICAFRAMQMALHPTMEAKSAWRRMPHLDCRLDEASAYPVVEAATRKTLCCRSRSRLPDERPQTTAPCPRRSAPAASCR